MYGIVMAGGKSSRMGREKPMLEFYGKRLLDISCEAVIHSGLRCMVAVSKNAPETYEYSKKKYDIIETSGIDYCTDIKFIYDRLKEPFLTIVSDLPFVTHNDIKEFLQDYRGKSMAGVVIKNGIVVYVGINIVSKEFDDEIHIFKNKLLSFNVNTMAEYEQALSLKNLSSFNVP